MTQPRVIGVLVLFAAVLLAACTSSDAAPPDEAAGDEPAGTVVGPSRELPAESGAEVEASADTGPAFVAAPALTGNPNETAPLAAVVTAETDEPAVLELTIDDGSMERVVVPDATPRTDHEAPVLGLRPAHSYAVRVAAIDEDGNTTEGPLELTLETPPLPADFPPLTVTQATAAPGDPRVTLFDAFRRHEDEDAEREGRDVLVMVDGQGEVVWYYDPGHPIHDVSRLRNGNLIFTFPERGIREIDMLGNTVTEWTAVGYQDDRPPGAIPVETDSFHHEVYELPEGDEADFLVLSSELREYPDYPEHEVELDPRGPARVLGDVIVAFRRDGTVVDEWRLLDILDPQRISYDSLNPHWQLVYDGETRDWSHGNAVILDPADGDLIVSLRNQDAVVKIDRETAELVWILGPHGRWAPPWSDALLTPVDTASPEDFGWSFHQHAPMFTPSGGLLIFDNGNYRAVPPEPVLEPEQRYSRLVEYQIDEAAGTVSQVWSYGGPDDPWYSLAVGDADYLPESDTILAVDGFRFTEDGQLYARLFEVTKDDPATIVFELFVRDDDSSEDPLNWVIYRAERLPSIYP